MDGYILGILIAIGGGFLLVAMRFLPSFRIGLPEADGQVEQASKQKKMIPTIIPSEALDVTDEAKFNFRNTRWGMPQDVVRRSEDGAAPVVDSPAVLIFQSKIAHIACQVIYSFTGDDKLCGARYLFVPDYVDGERYLADFEFILKFVRDKFGNPQKFTTHWLNRTFEDKKDFHALALMEGHFIRKVEWLTRRTSITYVLGNQEGSVLFCIDYTPAPEEKEEEEAVSE